MYSRPRLSQSGLLTLVVTLVTVRSKTKTSSEAMQKRCQNDVKVMPGSHPPAADASHRSSAHAPAQAKPGTPVPMAVPLR